MSGQIVFGQTPVTIVPSQYPFLTPSPVRPNTSQYGVSTTQLGYYQTSAAGTSNGIDLILPPSAATLIHVRWVARVHGTPGSCCAGEIAGLVYTSSSGATLYGASQSLWMVDPGSLMTSAPAVIGNGAKLLAGVNVSPAVSSTLDWQFVAVFDSN